MPKSLSQQPTARSPPYAVAECTISIEDSDNDLLSDSGEEQEES
jgi:hypothetical protein